MKELAETLRVEDQAETNGTDAGGSEAAGMDMDGE